jgi:hypothetical protein
MADSPILGITLLANSQVNQFALVNEAIETLEASSNDSLSIDLSAGNSTLTAPQFSGHFLFQTTGNAVSRTLTVPDDKRLFAVHNGGSATLNVTRGTTTLTVAASKSRLFYTDGTANGLVLLDFT